MRLVSRYHPLLVALHWLLAVLIILMLAGGFFLLARLANADPQKKRLDVSSQPLRDRLVVRNTSRDMPVAFP